MATNYSSDSDYDDFRFGRFDPGQRRESSSARPMAAETFDSDLDLDLDFDFDLDLDFDFAFRLQLQEALAASLAHLPAAAATATPIAVLRRDFFRRRSAERFARPFGEGSSRTAGESSSDSPAAASSGASLAHLPAAAAAPIAVLSRRARRRATERFARPFGEGSSRTAGESSSESPAAASSGASDQGGVFAVFFKGLVAEDKAGIGVAICDPNGRLIFEDKKPVLGHETSRVAVEAKALVEALTAALALGLSRIVFYCQNVPLHKFISGRWIVKQRKLAMLIDQVMSLQKKFVVCDSRCVSGKEVRFAYKLAKEVIESQLKTDAETRSRKNQTETCVICLEDNHITQILSVNGCNHRFCFSCIRQHVEYKLHNAMATKCPHEDCKSGLDLASCKRFLTPKFAEIMRQREKEAETPVAERVYCPNPKCSVLMSRAEVAEHSRKNSIDVDRLGARRCVKCQGLFCVNCKVPWHRNMNCTEYKLRNPNPPVEDTELKLLASMNLWRQCSKCNLVIELAEGCYHMTCRCGHEFCYRCGAEWKDKKATCKCPLWTEQNILYGEFDDSEDDEVEEEYTDDDDDVPYYNFDY